MEATHGKAIKQVAKESGVTNVDTDEYNEVKKELRQKEREASQLQTQLEGEKKDHQAAYEDRDRLIEWLSDENFKVPIHIVHETNFTTSRLLYAGPDPDIAQEKYREAENHVTMETCSIHGIPVGDVISKTAVDRLHNDANWWLDGFVVDGLKPMVTGDSDE
jgi:hypothetical protein